VQENEFNIKTRIKRHIVDYIFVASILFSIYIVLNLISSINRANIPFSSYMHSDCDITQLLLKEGVYLKNVKQIDIKEPNDVSTLTRIFLKDSVVRVYMIPQQFGTRSGIYILVVKRLTTSSTQE